jgi:hypothetical protein
MTRKSVINLARGLGVALMLCLAGFVIFAAFWGDIRIVRTEAQIRDQVQAQLERIAEQENANKNAILRNLKIQNIDVRLADTQVTIKADVEGRRAGRGYFNATAYAVGTPEYRSREFYFKASEFKVTSFTYKEGPLAPRISGLVERITRNEEANRMAAELAPRLESWVTSFAESMVKRGLERFPVYRLKDDTKGWLISASLKSVGVQNGELVITVSLWQLTSTVIVGLMIFALAVLLVIGLFMAPEVLIPMALLGAIH